MTSRDRKWLMALFESSSPKLIELFIYLHLISLSISTSECRSSSNTHQPCSYIVHHHHRMIGSSLLPTSNNGCGRKLVKVAVNTSARELNDGGSATLPQTHFQHGQLRGKHLLEEYSSPGIVQSSSAHSLSRLMQIAQTLSLAHGVRNRSALGGNKSSLLVDREEDSSGALAYLSFHTRPQKID